MIADGAAAWTGAIGTVAAFGIAVVIYGQAQFDRRKEQARRVSGWVPGGISLIPAGMPFGELNLRRPYDSVQLLVYVYNLSDELISDVDVRVVRVDGVDAGIEGLSWTDLGPGQKIENTHVVKDDGMARDSVRLAVSFTDARGRRWRRLGGSLEWVR